MKVEITKKTLIQWYTFQLLSWYTFRLLSTDSETSIYRIPNELFSADELLSKVDVWEVFKKEWYKDLGNNISVDTTYDFEDRKDEMSIL